MINQSVGAYILLLGLMLYIFYCLIIYSEGDTFTFAIVGSYFCLQPITYPW